MNAQLQQDNSAKTHYRKAFDSPYLSSADIVEATTLTIKYVALEKDRTKKTQELFNTAHFVEKELRAGEKLKPMILNATNSKMMKNITGSAFIDDWNEVKVSVYVDHNVKFGKESVEGLRIMKAPERRTITPQDGTNWANAKKAYLRDGNLNAVLSKADMSEDHQALLRLECKRQEPEA